MQRTQPAVAALKVMLVLAFALLVLFQTMSLPGQFAHMAAEQPDLAYLRWPLTAFAVMLRLPSSRAIERASPTSPAFDAA